jgi:predicted O-methyltransferase YrrM
MKIIPYMNSNEIVDLTTYLHRDCEMLEIGGGNSTLFFSRIVKRLVTVEHNKEWSDKISNDMKSFSKCDWSLYVIEPSFPQSHPFQPAEPGQFDDYVNFISNLEKNQFDVILVDGRDRVRCAIASIPLLRKDGILIIHDFWNRPKYHSVLQLHELELIKDDNSFENTENTLVAFKKK